jgi:ABC-2 type transport system ATP-binding protein
MLVIQNLSKSYGDELIVSVERLELPPGVYLFKGDNGSGKTTFFKSLAGLQPFQGQVSIADVPLRSEPVAYRYLVNFAEAEPLYPGFLTARDLIHFIGKTKKANREQQSWYAAQLGADSFLGKPCETYSSGMLKKLSLVLAFLGNPKMIILDEPLTTLDEQTRAGLFKLIREKKETVFLISSHHSIDSGSLHVDRTFVLRNKSLIAE